MVELGVVRFLFVSFKPTYRESVRWLVNRCNANQASLLKGILTYQRLIMGLNRESKEGFVPVIAETSWDGRFFV